MINDYHNIITRFIDEDLTTDDILLEAKVSRFYKTKQITQIPEIIDFLRNKSKSNLSLEFANELETLMKNEEKATPVQTPETVSIPLANTAEDAASADPKPEEIYWIAPETEIEIHPLAAAFPEMEGDEFEQFKASIKSDQQNPVIMDGNVLLDGRNRLNACRALGISAKAVQWNKHGTAEELIIALNLFRRHLTASQRAALAVKLLPALEQQAAERMEAGVSNPGEKIPQGKSVDLAGAQVGVSGKTVAKAKKIAEASEETYQKLLSGSVTLSQAAKEVKNADAPETQPDINPQPESKRYTLFEAIRKIILLVNDQFNDQLREIAAEAPPVISKALESCFPDEDSPATEDAAEESGIVQPGLNA